MANASILRLMSLAEREFNTNRAPPIRRKFKGMKLDLSKFEPSWDRRRGRAARLMAVLLRDDEQALYQRVSVDAATAGTFGEVVLTFKREATLLRRTAGLFETAAERIASVLLRYRSLQPATI